MRQLRLAISSNHLDSGQLKKYILALLVVETMAHGISGLVRQCKPEELVRLGHSDLPYKWVVAAQLTRLDIGLYWNGKRGTLALDPDMAAGASASIAHMMRMTRHRRKGLWDHYALSSWGNQLVDFVNLRRLDIRLIAPGREERQVDQVVKCAETWTFPINLTHELRFQSKLGWRKPTFGNHADVHHTGVIMRRSARLRAARHPPSIPPGYEFLETRFMTWVRSTR